MIRVALISAVTAAIPPAQTAIREALPEADVWNILDDRLLTDADARGGLDGQLRDRMNRLIAHAVSEGADAVLLTCSLYGSVAQDFAAAIPVLAPDQAAFDEIAETNYGRILVVASFGGARDDSVERLTTALRAAGSTGEVSGVAVPAAMAATKAGDHLALVQVVIDGIRSAAANVDAIFLAQYSLAPAGDELAAALGIPVLSGPKSSAAALRAVLGD